MPKTKAKPKGKGRCYEKALRYLLDHDTNGVCLKEIRLAHGEVIGRGPVKGIKFGHAWVEDKNKGIVINFDEKKPRLLPIAFYYRLGKIESDKVKRYTFKQAAILAVKTNHYGPWE